MSKRVLDVGNCRPDHAAICALLREHFEADVVQAHSRDEALAELQSGEFQLVLVNRKMDRDDSEGLEIIRQIKNDPRVAEIPCMLISNFTESQEAARQTGAEPGFGKADLHAPATVEKIRTVLG